VKKLVYLGLIVCGVSTLVGCATPNTLHTTVIPEQGHYTVIATAIDESSARDGAVQKATETCNEQGKELIVTKNDTKYQGSGKKLEQLTQMANSVSFQSGGPSLGMGSTRQTNDYKTTMVFKCQ
jgi:hypothetical protein